MGIAHFDDAPAREWDLGHLRGRWSFLGEAAGSVGVGLRRIEIPAGGWSTPAHEHGRAEEIFYVLAGRGVSWQNGRTTEVSAGDCIVYLAHSGAHTLHAAEGLDVLAFGPRQHDESVGFPRLEMSLVGRRAVESTAGAIAGAPFQFVRESELGPPELPEPGERPPTIVNLDVVKPERLARGRVARVRRDLGRAAGSIDTGLKHVTIDPGHESAPLHCHSLEEEIFVVLSGGGWVVLDDAEEVLLRPGHVVARPAGTGVSHVFRAGEDGATCLAYGTRDPGDVCFYPRSNKISFRGVGVIGRIERLDYWDGEDQGA